MSSRAPFTRVRRSDHFIYRDGDAQITDKAELDRIEAMVIPPAWEQVTIARSDRAKVLARGIDAAGRVQAIYHARYRARQEKLKFDRILRFAIALPSLRRQVTKDLARRRLDRAKVLATVVHLIDEDYFRVGNESYATEHGHYGITTLRSKHVDVEADTVTFDFVGKSGKEHHKEITDHQVAGIIRKLDEMPGYEIFRYYDKDGVIHDIHSGDVNAYIKEHMGEEFSAKDFRTWGGTLLAATELLASERADSESARRKIISETVKHVATRLGNTPTVARSSYIDPRIIEMYTDGKRMRKLRDTVGAMRPKRYMTRDETAVLRLLDS